MTKILLVLIFYLIAFSVPRLSSEYWKIADTAALLSGNGSSTFLRQRSKPETGMAHALSLVSIGNAYHSPESANHVGVGWQFGQRVNSSCLCCMRKKNLTIRGHGSPCAGTLFLFAARRTHDVLNSRFTVIRGNERYSAIKFFGDSSITKILDFKGDCSRDHAVALEDRVVRSDILFTNPNPSSFGVGQLSLTIAEQKVCESSVEYDNDQGSRLKPDLKLLAALLFLLVLWPVAIGGFMVSTLAAGLMPLLL